MREPHTVMLLRSVQEESDLCVQNAVAEHHMHRIHSCAAGRQNMRPQPIGEEQTSIMIADATALLLQLQGGRTASVLPQTVRETPDIFVGPLSNDSQIRAADI